jgi:hypothetical protein
MKFNCKAQRHHYSMLDAYNPPLVGSMSDVQALAGAVNRLSNNLRKSANSLPLDGGGLGWG